MEYRRTLSNHRLLLMTEEGRASNQQLYDRISSKRLLMERGCSQTSVGKPFDKNGSSEFSLRRKKSLARRQQQPKAFANDDEDDDVKDSVDQRCFITFPIGWKSCSVDRDDGLSDDYSTDEDDPLAASFSSASSDLETEHEQDDLALTSTVIPNEAYSTNPTIATPLRPQRRKRQPRSGTRPRQGGLRRQQSELSLRKRSSSQSSLPRGDSLRSISNHSRSSLHRGDSTRSMESTTRSQRLQLPALERELSKRSLLARQDSTPSLSQFALENDDEEDNWSDPLETSQEKSFSTSRGGLHDSFVDNRPLWQGGGL